MNGNCSQLLSPAASASMEARRRRRSSVTRFCLLCTVLAAATLWLSQIEAAAAAEEGESAIVLKVKPPALRALRPVLARLSKPTASAYLRIAAHEPRLVFETAEAQPERFTRDAFDIYKNTQAQLLKSPVVLTRALRAGNRVTLTVGTEQKQIEVAKLQAVRREDDPVRWLQNALQVSFPGDGEIMKVSLTGDDPQEAAALVNAVVDAYVVEVIDAERNRRNQRLSELDKVYVDKEEEVRRKATELRQLARAAGTSNPEALKLKQQMALQQFANLCRLHGQTQASLERARRELKGRRVLLQAVENLEISEIEVDIFSRSDPVASYLFERLLVLKDKLSDVEASGAASPAVEKLKGKVKALREELDARREQLRRALRQKKRAGIQVEISKTEVEGEVLAGQEQRLAKAVAEQEAEIERLSTSSIDLEIMRGEIDRLNSVLTHIHDAREKLKVELRSGPRVQVIERAGVPR